MKPRSPAEQQPPQQGALFAEEIVGLGVTDPELQVRETRFEPVDGGIFPEATASYEAPGGEALARSVHDAVVTDHRRKAQTGKHSPLQRDGTYEAVRPGDVLPQFGVVTYRNFDQAKAHARVLEAERRSKR
jgi:hypothetical protein